MLEKANSIKHGCLQIHVQILALCKSINSSFVKQTLQSRGVTITSNGFLVHSQSRDKALYLVQEQDEIKKFFLNFISDAVTYWTKSLCSES